jgi:hypothetical protein
MMFELGGGVSETLIDESALDPDENARDTYCIIYIESMDLTGVLAAALAALIAAYWIEDVNIYFPGCSGGICKNIPIGKYVALVAIFVALNVLGSTVNCQYKVWGRPLTRVRRTVQAEANDTEMQTKMGRTITETSYQDPISGSVAECQVVANYLKMVGMGERKRWGAEKVPDLRNEEGDTLSVLHPFTGQAITVFLTDNRIEFNVPEEGEGGDFNQTFEGWRR